jgi:GNAT superfamily N-acetyltransferase
MIAAVSGGAGSVEVAGRIKIPGRGVATIRIARAPLPAADGAALSWFLEGAFGADEKPDLFVTVAAKGLLEETAHNDFAWADVGGEIVTTAWTMTPADEPRLGTLGEVYTDPAWRGNGLAPAVCRALLDRFDAGGGRLIFLGTSNPSAARIYASLGFAPYPRGLMRRDAACRPRLEESWFAPSAAATLVVRPVVWGDIPRIVVLYATPNPWLSACWMQGLYAAPAVIHDRCNSLFKGTWQATQPGAWLALTTADGAIVGSGPMEPTGNEKDAVGADIDVFVHPAFQDQAPVLLDAMLAEARRRGWGWLRAELGTADGAKRALLEGVGFVEVGRLTDGLRIGGSTQDIHVLRLEV